MKNKEFIHKLLELLNSPYTLQNTTLSIVLLKEEVKNLPDNTVEFNFLIKFENNLENELVFMKLKDKFELNKGSQEEQEELKDRFYLRLIQILLIGYKDDFKTLIKELKDNVCKS